MTHAVIVENYVMGPGCDFVTGSIIAPAIDTGIDVDQFSRWGRVYLSVDTVAQYAGMIGWHPPTMLDDLNAEVDALVARVRELEAENETLQAAGDLLVQVAAVAAEIPDKGGDVSEGGLEDHAAVDSPSDTTDTDAPIGDVFEYPQAKGSGWYELSNGDTIRGEDAAIEAQELLDDEAGE